MMKSQGLIFWVSLLGPSFLGPGRDALEYEKVSFSAVMCARLISVEKPENLTDIR
jgi:hypothetical protein